MFYTADLTTGDQGTKRCGSCGRVLPIIQFHKRRDGRQAWCKSCCQKYDSAYHASTRERRLAQKRQRIAEHVAWMRELKARPCADCGGVFHPAAMSFDHLPGTDKLHDIASLVRRGSIGLARTELAKCELVCANCHAIRTFNRRESAA